MLYPPVADLLKNVDSRYLLVNVVAHRARQIAAEAEAFQEDLPEKPVTLAIREVADGKLSGSVKDEYKLGNAFTVGSDGLEVYSLKVDNDGCMFTYRLTDLYGAFHWLPLKSH